MPTLFGRLFIAFVIVCGMSLTGGTALGQDSRDAPAPLGTAAAVGDYDVTVLDVTADASALVAAENQFNDPPAAGKQFFMARIGIVYNGAEPGTPWLDLSFKAVGASGIGYTVFDNSCGVIPEEASGFSDLFEGASIEFNVCWEITSDDADSLVMYVEQTFAFDTQPVWFSLGTIMADGTAVSTPVSTESAATTSTRKEPLPIGTPGVVGDYVVSVVDVIPDASGEIAAENQFNDAPASGKQFYMVTASVTYTGDESGTPWIDLDFRSVGDSGVGYTTFDNDCGVVPNGAMNLSDIFPGGSVEFNVCWEVDIADVDSLQMYIEPLFAFDVEPMWFALTP